MNTPDLSKFESWALGKPEITARTSHQIIRKYINGFENYYDFRGDSQYDKSWPPVKRNYINNKWWYCDQKLVLNFDNKAYKSNDSYLIILEIDYGGSEYIIPDDTPYYQQFGYKSYLTGIVCNTHDDVMGKKLISDGQLHKRTERYSYKGAFFWEMRWE